MNHQANQNGFEQRLNYLKPKLDSKNKKPRRFLTDAPGHKPGNDLLSHRIVAALPSAATGLTLVFGMGTGVSPRL